MSKYDIGLIIFATFLMVAITISYIVKYDEEETISVQSIASSSTELTFPDVVRIKKDNYEAWVKPSLPKKLRNADQFKKELIEHIRDNWILPPSYAGRRLHHPEQYDHSEFGESFVVDKMLKNRESGFYVDAWAADGETNSNTLFMEKDRMWKGILIEPNPHEFVQLIGKRRQAYMLNACVSPSTTPVIMNLTYETDGFERTMDVQCFPMYSILAALGVVQVDFMSLRTGGGMEADIIRSMPIKDDLDVKIWVVRTFVEEERRQSAKNMAKVKDLLESNGCRWIDAGEKINKFDVIMLKET